jgi:hypothetical protein
MAREPGLDLTTKNTKDTKAGQDWLDARLSYNRRGRECGVSDFPGHGMELAIRW